MEQSKQTKQVDNVSLKGKVKIELFDEKGELKECREFTNTFMTVGKNHVADQLEKTPGEVKMGWMAIGTSGTTKGVGDTSLNKAIDRNALNSGYPEQGGTTLNTVVYKANWAAGDGTGALQEAGIFNSSGAGTMLCAATFAVVNKGVSDSLSIVWTITTG